MASYITAAKNGLSYINPFKAKPEPVKKKPSLIGWIKNHKVETIGIAASAVLTTALVATAVASLVLSCGTSGLIACAALGVGATVAAGGTVIIHLETNTSFVPVKEKEKIREWSLSKIAVVTAGGVVAGVVIGGAALLGALNLVL